MKLFGRRKTKAVEQRTGQPISISNPRLMEALGYYTANYSGVEVTEQTALTISAVTRAVTLISGQLAQLPLQTVRYVGDTNTAMRSFLDNPGGDDGPTPFEWKETVLLHLLLHGNAFLMHVYGGAGQLLALQPIHPMYVQTDWADVPGRKLFTASMFSDNTYSSFTTREFDSKTMTHIPYISLDGLRGMSPIALARNGFGTAIAAERAAANMFNKGMLATGLITPDDDIDNEELQILGDEILRHTGGYENASSLVYMNRKLKVQPWTVSPEDMQFIQSRQFQIEEIARWFGVPPHLLMQTEKQTSWGTGVEEQNRALSRTVLGPWANRVEQRLSRLLPSPRSVEFDFSKLERPTAEGEINLLNRQIDGGLMTINEARAIRNMPGIGPDGDILRYHGTPVGSPQPIAA